MSSEGSTNNHLNEYLRKVLEREETLAKEFFKKRLFEADRSDRPKIFITFPYPYMNGSLHLGHAYSSGRLDVYARYKRLKGFNVLFPWAWHWTGEAVYGTIHRLREEDKEVIDRLVNLDGVDKNEIDNLKDPIYFVKYFTDKNREVIKRFGLSIDLSREFHTTYLHPLYNKFVEWQVRVLHKKGYIVRGSHPVVWCPVDQSPTGDHDRLEGEGVRPEKYFIIKFKMDDSYLVAGTLRPETILGVTNIWVNPRARYIEIEVDGEKWIVSIQASEKLKEQLRNVKVIGEVQGESLIGKWVEAPITNRKVPILPADFVDPESVTGVVYSVPAHAPYDYLALRDLKRSEARRFLREIIDAIEPIGIIEVDGYGEYPAVEIVEKLGIHSQLDREKADEATRKIYLEEFNRGVMRRDLPYIGGVKTSEARDRIFELLKSMGLADIMYDLPEPVICRCTAKCIVKILPDQWFIKYSDSHWKKEAHKAVDSMGFFPTEIKQLFHHYIDWYDDWPCTRRSGLGTPFPLDKDWIVETLTDSTIYQAFYIVSKYYNEGLINVEGVDDDFFNYVFLGEGSIDLISDKTGIEPDILEKIRGDFLYWYPVDVRSSGKDLIGNHLTFFIFHHVAIFPRDKWPRAISANGFTMLNGRPMSKSKGNYLSIEKAISVIGADALRLSLLSLVDGLDDPDWNMTLGYKALEKMRGLEKLAKDIVDLDVDGGDYFLDSWLENSIYKMVRDVSNALEAFRVAYAARIIFDNMLDSIKKYMYMAGNPNKRLLRRIIEDVTILASMYTPFLAQSIWRNILEREGYVFFQPYPDKSVDEKPLIIDEYLEALSEDISDLYGVVGGGTIVVRVADENMWHLFKKLSELSESDGGIPEARNIVRKFLTDKRQIGEVMKFVNREWFGRMRKFRPLYRLIDREVEKHLLTNYLGRYLSRRGLHAEVIVIEDEKGLEGLDRIKPSYPLYPAVYIIKKLKSRMD